jgi:hypothetical protein
MFWPLHCVFETCKMKSVLKLYFERYSFTFQFTKFLSHFLKNNNAKQKLFFNSSLVKKSFRFYVYILSRNREKQLCTKAIKSSHNKLFWKRVLERVRIQETLQQQNENSFISDFNWTDIWILFYSLKLYTKTIIRLRLSDYGEYSHRLRLGEYSPVITSPSASNC